MKPSGFNLLALTFVSMAGLAVAHEIESNRATIVLRDQTHISLTLYLSYTDALHLALAPQQSMTEFSLTRAPMAPEVFRQQVSVAEARFMAATHLYLASGEEVPLTHWAFPDSSRVLELLQKRVMQSIVDPAGHMHDEPMEIHAEASSPEPVTAIRVRFPEEFQKVLLVAYRPAQYWVEPKTWSPQIRF